MKKLIVSLVIVALLGTVVFFTGIGAADEGYTLI